MAPTRRKKLAQSAYAAEADCNGQPVPSQNQPLQSLPPKSPLREVQGAGIVKRRKAALIDNLRLEVGERVRKLRSSYAAQSRALRQRIEMRVNRVPKKMWTMTMQELLSKSEGYNPLGDLGGSVALANEVSGLSRGEGDDGKDQRLVVPKKRNKKTAVAAAATARERMPPPPLPIARPLSPSKSNLLPLSPLQQTSSTDQPLPQRRVPPIKNRIKGARSRADTTISTNIAPTRASSRATARSSTETMASSVTSASEGNALGRSTKSSQAKSKGSTAAKSAPGLKRGGTKGNGSSGSLKENKVAGVREPKKTSKQDVPATRTTGRVLRSRK